MCSPEHFIPLHYSLVLTKISYREYTSWKTLSSLMNVIVNKNTISFLIDGRQINMVEPHMPGQYRSIGNDVSRQK